MVDLRELCDLIKKSEREFQYGTGKCAETLNEITQKCHPQISSNVELGALNSTEEFLFLRGLQGWVL